MTNNKLDNYLSFVENEKNILKQEIKNFFELNKNNEKIFSLINNEFEFKIREFEQKYNMTSPEKSFNTLELNISLEKTIKIYLDLARYPDELLKSLNQK